VSPSVHFYDLHPKPADMRAEVMAGLSQPQKRIAPKFFYDRKGSLLFDAITELPEYYPTRTEVGILRSHGAEMAELVGQGALLVELGSGSSQKIRLLLGALQPAIYVPVDISREHLMQSASDLAASFPGLEVHAACADYSGPFELPIRANGHECVAFFPGSSIGNFDPGDAVRFLRQVGTLVAPGGKLLIGVDLIKDLDILNAAYNDTRGVTADFNLNLLERINRELDGGFNPSLFQHEAFFNEDEARIEMHLVSQTAQTVQVAGEDVTFREGESIHTESSYKYTIEGFQKLARKAGFEPGHHWTDASRLFSVHCLQFVG
jgi:dimethylhistidine N-methyltransferase